jgi:hypothetical protein
MTGADVANASAQLKAVHSVAEQQGQLQCSVGAFMQSLLCADMVVTVGRMFGTVRTAII